LFSFFHVYRLEWVVLFSFPFLLFVSPLVDDDLWLQQSKKVHFSFVFSIVFLSFSLGHEIGPRLDSLVVFTFSHEHLY